MQFAGGGIAPCLARPAIAVFGMAFVSLFVRGNIGTGAATGRSPVSNFRSTEPLNLKIASAAGRRWRTHVRKSKIYEKRAKTDKLRETAPDSGLA